MNTPCSTDPELFFPPAGGGARKAKALCFSCDVRRQCLEQALARHEQFGIWGGLSERERRAILTGRADPEQFAVCRNGHDLSVAGLDDDGFCQQCVADRKARDRVRKHVKRSAA